MFVFADQQDPTDANARVNALCEFLRHDKASLISAHTPPGADIDSVIEVCAVFQQSHQDIALERTHAKPAKGGTVCTTWKKCLCRPSWRRRHFLMRGIDKAAGCIVVVRPDQYIAHVLPLDSCELSAFFEIFEGAGMTTKPQRTRRYQHPFFDSARWNGFAPRAGDMVVCTSYKSGTTWTQMICALLVHQTPNCPSPCP